MTHYQQLRAALPVLVASSSAVALVADPAAAYVDPGAGSMIIQAIIAASVGGAVALKMQWRRIKGWLTGSAGNDASTSEADDGR